MVVNPVVADVSAVDAVDGVVEGRLDVVEEEVAVEEE